MAPYLVENLNGLIFQREFFEWEENKGYKLYIHQIGKPKSRVEWKIKGDSYKSIINISVSPYLFNSGNKYFNILECLIVCCIVLYCIVEYCIV